MLAIDVTYYVSSLVWVSSGDLLYCQSIVFCVIVSFMITNCIYKQTMEKFAAMPDVDIQCMVQEISKIKPSKLKHWSARTRFPNGQFIKIKYKPLTCLGEKALFVVSGRKLNRANVLNDDVFCDLPILSLSQSLSIEKRVPLEKTFDGALNDTAMKSGLSNLNCHYHTGNHRPQNHFIKIPARVGDAVRG